MISNKQMVARLNSDGYKTFKTPSGWFTIAKGDVQVSYRSIRAAYNDTYE